jgi:hypothetical protein
MTKKMRARVLYGVASGLTGPGMVLVSMNGRVVRAHGLRERFQRSDVETLRGDVIRVGETIRGVLDRETKTVIDRG